MNIVGHGGIYTYPLIKNSLIFSGILSLAIVLMSCSSNETDNSNIGQQRHLILELEKNQLLWSQSGVSDYSLSIQKVYELLYTSELQKEAVVKAVNDPFLAKSCRKDLLKRWGDNI